MIKNFEQYFENISNRRKVEIYIKSAGNKFYPSNNLIDVMEKDLKKMDSTFTITNKNGKLPGKTRIIYANTYLTPRQIMDALGKRKEKQDTFYFEVVSKGRI